MFYSIQTLLRTGCPSHTGTVTGMSRECAFRSTSNGFQIGWRKLRWFSVAIGIVKLNAFAAGAISNSFMEISAMLADPDRWNSARKAMLAIADIPAFFSLFPHVFPSNETRLAVMFDAATEELPVRSRG
jgi:hypothetical protein